MYTPGGRTGRTPGGAKRIVAAVGIALMGMGGVALAAPKADPGPPEQAQGNGPPPQAQDPPPAPQAKANANGHAQQVTSGPAEVPQALPPQAGGDDNPGSGAGRGGQSGQGGTGYHGRPAPGESRGLGPKRPNPGKARGCQAARCQAGTPEPSAGASGGGGEQSTPAGGQQGAAEGNVLGVSEDRPDEREPRTVPDKSGTGAAPESGSALGLNQGGGEEVYAARGSFDGALPFTGFELALVAGIGALLGLAGVRLRRSTA